MPVTYDNNTNKSDTIKDKDENIPDVLKAAEDSLTHHQHHQDQHSAALGAHCQSSNPAERIIR
jgi:hypothetical protein